MREQEAAKEGLGFKSPVFLDPSKPNKALKASLQVLQAQPNAVFNLILILSFCHEFLLLYLRFLLIMVFFFFLIGLPRTLVHSFRFELSFFFFFCLKQIWFIITKNTLGFLTKAILVIIYFQLSLLLVQIGSNGRKV